MQARIDSANRACDRLVKERDAALAQAKGGTYAETFTLGFRAGIDRERDLCAQMFADRGEYTYADLIRRRKAPNTSPPPVPPGHEPDSPSQGQSEPDKP